MHGNIESAVQSPQTATSLQRQFFLVPRDIHSYGHVWEKQFTSLIIVKAALVIYIIAIQ